MFCPRCNKTDAKILLESVFNDDLICITCREKEKQHTSYNLAVESHAKAEIEGNKQFTGIGIPKDLS